MSDSVDGFTRYEINRHTVTTEPHRIVHLILHGRLDAEESMRFRTIMYDHGDACGALAILADISKADGITTEATNS